MSTKMVHEHEPLLLWFVYCLRLCINSQDSESDILVRVMDPIYRYFSCVANTNKIYTIHSSCRCWNLKKKFKYLTCV